MMKLPRLQYITDSVTQVERACAAGIKWVQGRIKNKPEEETKSILVEMKNICDKHKCIFVINDFIELALEIKANGVHLGKNDTSIEKAKKIIKDPNFILGGTANTLEDVKKLEEHHVHYIGLGPLRFTETKVKLSPLLGFEGYKNILETRSYNSIPIFAIGGILPSDVTKLVETGVYGIAVSSYLSKSENMKNALSEFEPSLNTVTHAG